LERTGDLNLDLLAIMPEPDLQHHSSIVEVATPCPYLPFPDNFEIQTLAGISVVLRQFASSWRLNIGNRLQFRDFSKVVVVRKPISLQAASPAEPILHQLLFLGKVSFMIFTSCDVALNTAEGLQASAATRSSIGSSASAIRCNSCKTKRGTTMMPSRSFPRSNLQFGRQ